MRKHSLSLLLISVILLITISASAADNDLHFLRTDSCIPLDALLNAGLDTYTFKTDASSRAMFAFVASYALFSENVIDSDYVVQAALDGNMYAAFQADSYALYLLADHRLIVLFRIADAGKNYCCYTETPNCYVDLSKLLSETGCPQYWNISLTDYINAVKAFQ